MTFLMCQTQKFVHKIGQKNFKMHFLPKGPLKDFHFRLFEIPRPCTFTQKWPSMVDNSTQFGWWLMITVSRSALPPMAISYSQGRDHWFTQSIQITLCVYVCMYACLCMCVCVCHDMYASWTLASFLTQPFMD